MSHETYIPLTEMKKVLKLEQFSRYRETSEWRKVIVYLYYMYKIKNVISWLLGGNKVQNLR